MKMLVGLSKSHVQTLIFNLQTLHNSNHCLITTIIRTYSTNTIIPTNVDSSEFKISFLKNKCGLSGKDLVRASKYVDFDSSDQRPDSVLQLFRTFGFPMSNVTKIISFHPRVLKEFHPQNILKPKLDFLLSLSQSQAEVVAIVTRNPVILVRSLTSHLIPSLNLLNSVTGSYPITLSVLKNNPYILCQNLPKSLLLNTEFLLKLGVPHSHVLKLLTSYGPVLGTLHDKFRNVLLKLKDLDFDLKSTYFCHAVRALCYAPDSTWESRCVLFRSFGFSNHEILSMFKKLPNVMCYTEKNIKEKLELFLNKLQWTPFRLSSNPVVLGYSLKKRTIPRCSVLQVLVSKNCTSESYMLSTILAMTDKRFIEIFVTAHKDEIPGVLEAYQGKLRFDEYTFK
ncbi:hypothetical protein POM88_035282 [Heracleum sosnowskyi]|uniref:Uncharacterized protein n=1 Tax=Heracleum sosnowskyi TaxID=360622 RepID=A0AAD8HN64_9APIA|nr:hypothetical protein POM88_035282 [Heracleum sosnowskyi]